MNILLVEDDVRISSFVARGLKAEGHSVDVAGTGSKGLELGFGEHLSLIILDVMLPGLSGREVCRRLRDGGVATPILMLTALDSVEDRVGGLKTGADDYLTKPFAFEELLARIEALSRRSGSYKESAQSLRMADLELDRGTLQVRRGNRPVELTAKELALLEFLMVAGGQVVSRTRILESVWGQTTDPMTNIVDVYVRRLRAKIDEGHKQPLIHTVRGYGYRMSPSRT